MRAPRSKLPVPSASATSPRATYAASASSNAGTPGHTRKPSLRAISPSKCSTWSAATPRTASSSSGPAAYRAPQFTRSAWRTSAVSTPPPRRMPRSASFSPATSSSARAIARTLDPPVKSSVPSMSKRRRRSGLRVERLAAPARRLYLRVAEGEPGGLDAVDVIDLGVLHEAHGARVDANLDAVLREDEVVLAALVVEVRIPGKAAAAAGRHGEAQRNARLAIGRRQALDVV